MLLVPGAQADLAVSDPTPGPALVDVELTETRVLHYQGRLLNPSSGQPRPDGSYSMIFKLYDVETGGTALWTETKNVEVSRGLFSTLLGDTTPLNLGDFDGRDLWLGVTVGADPEATPRQRVAWVAYALHADTADSATDATYLEGYNSSAFYKGYSGVQYTETTPLAAGASETVFTFGYSPDQLVVWWVKPTTNGGKLH